MTTTSRSSVASGLSRTFGVTLALLCVATTVVRAQDSTSDDAAIRKPVADYNRGLNTCDVEVAVKAWERDGVFMPPNQPAVEGEQALRAWYKNYCSRTVANLTFAPTEARRFGDWAWLRVAITGTTTSKASRTVTQQDNKALFIVHRGADGTWRIARYGLNSNKTAAAPATR